MERFLQIVTLITATIILSGCGESPTTIVGSVSLLNPDDAPFDFPNTAHSGDFTDDVCMVRLIDSNTPATVLWESEAFSASSLASAPARTTDSGILITTFRYSPPDSVINDPVLVLPLKFEAFLLDAAPVSPTTLSDILDTAVPPARCYSVNSYDAITATVGKPGWQVDNVTIRSGEIKNISLSVGTVFE